MTNTTLPSPIIDAADIATLAPPPVLVDVRWYLDGRTGLDAYRISHLEGAIFLDLDRALASHGPAALGRHPLPTPEEFATALGVAGIQDDDFVVAYDDSGGGTAARLVWLLRAIGQKAAVLNGGMSSWTGGREQAVKVRKPVSRTVIAWPSTLLTTLDALDEAEEGSCLLDARATERFRGEVEPVDPRPGHIPGAKSLPWTSLLSPDGRVKPKDQVAAAFLAAGVDRGDELIASCGSGVTACMLLVTAAYAGLGEGRLFVPSFSGWSSDPKRDVALGD